MKKKCLTLILVVNCFIVTLAQKELNQTVQLELGRPAFLDSGGLSGTGLGVHYTYTFNNSFEVSGFYNYTWGGDFPDDGRNMEALRRRLIGQPLDVFFREFPYQEIENHQLGLSIGWLFLNNRRWKYGMSIGGGLVLSNKSEVTSQIEWSSITIDAGPATLTNFVLNNTKTDYNGTFFRIAMDLDYTFLDMYTAGLSISYLTQQSDFDPSRVFILSNHFMPSFKIGKKF